MAKESNSRLSRETSMSEQEYRSIEFITIGTVGPKGKRQFNLQAGGQDGIMTLTLEKEQARRLAEAVTELLDELKKKQPENAVNFGKLDMDLREPIEPSFRIAQMGLGYDEGEDQVVLVVEELVVGNDDDLAGLEAEPSIVRIWGSREQYRALAIHTLKIVDLGRPDPQRNGYVIYYWV
jgi:uncharacterized repeat protein (TIGR03847 family)